MGLLRVGRVKVNKGIGIKEEKELKKMSEKSKKRIGIGLCFGEVVVE